MPINIGIHQKLSQKVTETALTTIRAWLNHFGPQIAAQIRRDWPHASDKWHMDEVVITIRGERHWLWRAVDSRGDVLEILVQSRRDARAAKRFLRNSCATGACRAWS